jgi:hypothetical protein
MDLDTDMVTDMNMDADKAWMDVNMEIKNDRDY